ncbi:MAG: hypothetical protein KA155_00110 [Alphaproteobacteria bacterium]|jgi:hypothetical protein|nr:hypothetical protein [Alphaproteobacteria bacterium]
MRRKEIKKSGVKMLNKKELATIANRLQVPLIISDILAGEGELTDDVHYGLHSVISDLQPDSALICIALGGLKIANAYHVASPGLAVLKIQCESVIDDYAGLWLQNAENEDVAEHDALDALSNVSEDLEGLSDLLALAIDSLQSKNPDASALAKILSIQAKAHAVIADELFGALYAEVTGEIDDEKIVSVIAGKMNDNVIPFPAKRQA